MASSLNEKKTIEQMIDEDLAKYRARAERDQERIDELAERNTYLADSIRSGLVVPTTGFVMGYARGYYGEKASVLGISLDAAASLLFNGLAALFGFSANKGVQTAAKLCGDVAHGALACWAAAMGAELGLQKRMEKPALPPAPRPITGAQDMPQRAPRPLTHEELAAIKADMPHRAPSPLSHEELAAFAAWQSVALTQSPTPPMPRANPLPKAEAVAPKAPVPQSPAQSPAPPKMNPLPRAEAVAPMAPARAPIPQSPALQQSQSNTQQIPSANAESAPAASSTRKTHFRFTQRRPVDGEGGLTSILRSFGIPPISETTNWPSPEYSIENFDRISRWARAPA